jgi:hypothetical protein
MPVWWGWTKWDCLVVMKEMQWEINHRNLGSPMRLGKWRHDAFLHITELMSKCKRCGNCGVGWVRERLKAMRSRELSWEQWTVNDLRLLKSNTKRKNWTWILSELGPPKIKLPMKWKWQTREHMESKETEAVIVRVDVQVDGDSVVTYSWISSHLLQQPSSTRTKKMFPK